MDHKQVCWAGVPCLVGAVLSYALTKISSPWGDSAAVAMLAASIAWPVVVWHLTARSPLRIEDYEVSNALNLRITNRRVKEGIVDDILLLHSIELWNPGRGQLQAANLRSQNITPMPLPLMLTNDQPNLPHKVPRMFQLVQFTDPSAPFIQGYGPGNRSVVICPLTVRGFYRLRMELLWAGGRTEIMKDIDWGRHSSPRFCKKPPYQAA